MYFIKWALSVYIGLLLDSVRLQLTFPCCLCCHSDLRETGENRLTATLMIGTERVFEIKWMLKDYTSVHEDHLNIGANEHD